MEIFENMSGGSGFQPRLKFDIIIFAAESRSHYPDGDYTGFHKMFFAARVFNVHVD
jgi:hypothetical protein